MKKENAKRKRLFRLTSPSAKQMQLWLVLTLKRYELAIDMLLLMILGTAKFEKKLLQMKFKKGLT